MSSDTNFRERTVYDQNGFRVGKLVRLGMDMAEIELDTEICPVCKTPAWIGCSMVSADSKERTHLACLVKQGKLSEEMFKLMADASEHKSFTVYYASPPSRPS